MIWTLIIGLVVGTVAKFLMPGRGPGGIIMTIILGIGGAMLSSWAGGAMGAYAPGEPVSFISAVIGSMIILFLYHMILRNSKK
jgi:uncharacterized membrane protein YeaQ/YmgE (transglycosylase-associated protein family)